MIKKFKKFIIEKVQDNWFDNNPNFYLSKNVNDIKKFKDDESIKIKQLKTIKPNDIKFKHNIKKGKYDGDSYEIVNPSFLLDNKFHTNFNGRGSYSFSNIVIRKPNEVIYKIYLSFINHVNKKTIIFKDVDKVILSPLFKELNNYYGLYYKENLHYDLFLTKYKSIYLKKIKSLKKSHIKILYYNSKIQNKEFLDIDNININKLKNKLKDISYDDIFFDKNVSKSSNEPNMRFYDRYVYSVKFKDINIDNEIVKYKLISLDFFTRETDIYEEYFGHLRNRYHSGTISDTLKNIGLGYKIYKSFLKLNGYLISDIQTTQGARKMYYNMMKDDDIYYIVDKDRKDGKDKIMVIWKSYKNIKKLLKIVKEHEKKNNLNYEYDKGLSGFV